MTDTKITPVQAAAATEEFSRLRELAQQQLSEAKDALVDALALEGSSRAVHVLREVNDIRLESVRLDHVAGADGKTSARVSVVYSIPDELAEYLNDPTTPPTLLAFMSDGLVLKTDEATASVTEA